MEAYALSIALMEKEGIPHKYTPISIYDDFNEYVKGKNYGVWDVNGVVNEYLLDVEFSYAGEVILTPLNVRYSKSDSIFVKRELHTKNPEIIYNMVSEIKDVPVRLYISSKENVLDIIIPHTHKYNEATLLSLYGEENISELLYSFVLSDLLYTGRIQNAGIFAESFRHLCRYLDNHPEVIVFANYSNPFIVNSLYVYMKSYALMAKKQEHARSHLSNIRNLYDTYKDFIFSLERNYVNREIVEEIVFQR